MWTLSASTASGSLLVEYVCPLAAWWKLPEGGEWIPTIQSYRVIIISANMFPHSLLSELLALIIKHLNSGEAQSAITLRDSI